MKVKEESEKFGLKLNIQKTKIMAFGPNTSWQIDGETVEIVADFILGGSKITASLVAQRLKHLPAMWETWVQSLGWEDLLENEMATHSSTLAWRIPWMEEPGGLQSIHGVTKSRTWLGESLVVKSLQVVTAAMKLKDACSLEEKLWPT